MSGLKLSTQILIIVLICLVIIPLTTLTVILPVYRNATLNERYDELQRQLATDRYYDSRLKIDQNGNIGVLGLTEDDTALPREILQQMAVKISEMPRAESYGMFQIEGGGEIYYAYKTQNENNRIIVFQTGLSIYESLLLGGQNMTPLLVTVLFMLLPVIIIMIWFAYVSQSVKSIELSLSQGRSKKFIASKELQSLADSIEVYKNELEQATKQKQRLMQNISHELKTPITTIKMYAEGIEDGIFRDNDLKKSTQIIKEESDVLLDRVNKIMDINKLYEAETNKIVDKEAHVVLSEVVFECLEKYSKRAPFVKFDAKLERAEWRGSKEMWTTVIENIFDNNIRHKAKRISIVVKKNTVVIENDGEKIDEDILPRIFEPFMKGERGNFGLGLNIIQRSLNMHNYAVELSNTEEGVMYKISSII